MKQFNIYITGVLGLLALCAMGQPTGGNLGQLELSVTDKYKATVVQATKIKDFPTFKDTTTQKLPVAYKITSVPITVNYRPRPLPPAQIAKVPVEKLKQGLVRVGIGFYGTPLAEAYWNADRSSKQAYGFWGKHLSTQRGVKNTVFDNNSFSHNQLGGYYTRFYRDLKWTSELSGFADKQSYYGVPKFSPVTTDLYQDTSAPAIWRSGLQFSTALENISNKQGNFEKSTLRYTLHTNSYKAQEHNVANMNQFLLPTGGTPLKIDLGVEFTQSMDDTLINQDLTRNSFIVQARPHIEATLKNINFDFGLNLYTNSVTRNSLVEDTAFTDVYFFPEIAINYPLVKDVLSVYGGFKGRLVNNTYASLARQNPFLFPSVQLTPTFERDVYIGLKGILSGSSSFNIKGGIMNNTDQLIFQRIPNYVFQDTVLQSGLPAINVIYDDAVIYYFRGELTFNVENNLQFNLFGEARSYDMKTLDAAFHLPNFTAGLQAKYTIREKIALNADLNYIGKRTVFAKSDFGTLSNTIDGYLNANLGVEYLYNSRLSAFINLYNVLSTPNELFLGYESQRFNAMFGIGYQF